MNYLEAVGVTVDVEMLNGDLGIIAHLLSAECTGGRQRAPGEVRAIETS